MEQQQLIGESNQFNEKINTIKSQFFSALDEFKKYYVYYNKNPEVNEFQNYYVNSKSQLQSMSRDLFLTTNNIDKNIENLDNKMVSISEQLDDEKKLNKEMMKLIANLENTQNGSEILIDDSKTKYNEQYLKNWEIFIGIILVSALIGKLFKNNTSMKLNMGVDILNETEERNIEWLKKIFDYLDKNPTKNIAIIVGGAHIFGFDEKNKKTGKTLPNLLSKMKNVKNVNYSTL